MKVIQINKSNLIGNFMENHKYNKVNRNKKINHNMINNIKDKLNTIYI